MRADGKAHGVRGCGVAHKLAVKFGGERLGHKAARQMKRRWAKRVRRDALAREA